MEEQSIVRKSDEQSALFLKDIGERILKFAARDYDSKTFLGSIMLAFANDEKLQRALASDEGKISVYNALQKAAVTGLSLNPMDGHACLIAYESKGKYVVNYLIMKEGVIQLALSSGASQVSCDLVRDNDEFEYTVSSDGDVFYFKPSIRDRGPVIGYYAAMQIDDKTRVSYMTVTEIEEHRDRYATSLRLGDKSPWVKSFDGMALKTVVKKLIRTTKFKIIRHPDMFGDSESPRLKGHSPEDVHAELEEKIEEQRLLPESKSEQSEEPQKDDSSTKSVF